MTGPRRQELATNLAQVEERIAAACASSGRERDDVHLVVVKPYAVADLLAQVRDSLRPGSVVVSLALGVSLADLAAALPDLDYDCGLGTASLLAADVTELKSVEGVGEHRARIVREGLNRIVEEATES